MFDQKTLEHLKKLCRLECTPEEEAKLLHSLQNVLRYMDELKQVPTEGVAACNYVLRNTAKHTVRNDEPSHLLSREKFLSNAPDQIGGMVRVPPILKPS
jgi:aspartyl-tRNA(Asn)/glutamyl-tRNA(Gln) amidotransferase subunit C